MRTTAAILLLAAATAGCQNPSATLAGAGERPLPDLAPAGEPLARDGVAVTLDGTPVARGDAAERAGRTTTLDRSGWAANEVVQPRGQVEVQPTYYRLFEGLSGDPRATGRYPTTATALQTHDEAPAALADAAVAPVVGIGWLVIVPGHVVVVPPWTVRRQPGADGIEWLPPRPER
jgi:hypothetical protein